MYVRFVLIPIVVGIALFRRAAQLEERAVGAPRLGVEAGAGDRQHVAVPAAFRTLFGWTPPAARLELHHRLGDRRFDARLSLSFARSGRCWGKRVGHSLLILCERQSTFP